MVPRLVRIEGVGVGGFIKKYEKTNINRIGDYFIHGVYNYGLDRISNIILT